MRKLIIGIGGFVGSSIFWWAAGAAGGGFMTEFIVSTIGTGIGMYAGYKMLDRMEI